MTDRPVDPTDEQLVAQVRGAAEGDLRAFELLLERHKERIVANCRFLTRSPGDAEDLAQEVFIKAFYGLPRFEGRSSFATWIKRIKVNHSLNFLKKQEGRTFVEVEKVEERQPRRLSVEPQADRNIATAETQARIAAVLDEMNDTLRIPLVLRDLDQLSYQEIADLLGLGLSAVKMRIKRGRQDFRERYAASDETGDA